VNDCYVLTLTACSGSNKWGGEMFFFKENRVVEQILTTSITLIMILFALPAYTAEEAVGGDNNHQADGKNVYDTICQHCHETGVGPVIKGRQLPVEYITYIVRHGVRAMPAFPEPYISNEDLKSLGQYIQQTTSAGK